MSEFWDGDFELLSFTELLVLLPSVKYFRLKPENLNTNKFTIKLDY